MRTGIKTEVSKNRFNGFSTLAARQPEHPNSSRHHPGSGGLSVAQARPKAAPVKAI
jgi:hypothetical protein